MPRGVDAELFHPAKRTRKAEDREAVLGFVGRLSVEKNVALLAKVQQELERMGLTNFHFLFVGHGAEENWLRERLPRPSLRVFCAGKHSPRLMRIWICSFSPRTPTPSATWCLKLWPAECRPLVTPDGGPPTIVRDGQTGRIVPDAEFATAIAGVLADSEKHAQMRLDARAYALTASWDSVFEGVYKAYETILPMSGHAAR